MSQRTSTIDTARLCRVFLSYSHSRRDLAERVGRHLTSLGVHVLSDESIVGGELFTDVIKRNISRCHIFVPLLTTNSQSSSWVHQEIGFAMGTNVPILPIAIGVDPEDMIQQLQVVKLPETLESLEARVTRNLIERVLQRSSDATIASYQRAAFALDRAKMLVQVAREVYDEDGPVRIRQQSDLSSFAIPDVPVESPRWDDRDGSLRRDIVHREALRNERRMMERHARGAGCSLIVDQTFVIASGQSARRTRVAILLEFLESLSNDRVEIAVRMRPAGDPSSVIIVGDWCSATSVSPRPGQGYRETLFTWHAPTVRQSVAAFDQELSDLLAEQRIDPVESRPAAIDILRSLLDTKGSDA